MEFSHNEELIHAHQAQKTHAFILRVGHFLSQHLLFRFLRRTRTITATAIITTCYYLIIGNIQPFSTRTQTLLFSLLVFFLLIHLSLLIYLLVLLCIHKLSITQKKPHLFRVLIISWGIEAVITVVGISIISVLQVGIRLL